MIKPVFIFVGFLDSGKTTAIKTSLNDSYFNDGSKTLIIQFEYGTVEFDTNFEKETNSEVIALDYQDFNHEKMQEINNHYIFDRIIIEFNGFDNVLEFVEKGFIKGWDLAEIMCFINCETFNSYIINLKQHFYNQIKLANLIVFNRYTDQDKLYFRNNIKPINHKATIIYENMNNEVILESVEEIFDLSKGHLTISDLDYGLWYIDALSSPLKYENKHISINVKLLEDLKDYPKALIMGREAMVCCAADIAPIGITCVGIDKKKIQKNQYYRLSGTIHLLDDHDNNKTCALYIDQIEESIKPKEELVLFR